MPLFTVALDILPSGVSAGAAESFAAGLERSFEDVWWNLAPDGVLTIVVQVAADTFEAAGEFARATITAAAAQHHVELRVDPQSIPHAKNGV